MPSCLTAPVLDERFPLPGAAPVAPLEVTEGDRESLLTALGRVPDPRDPRGVRYPIVAMVTVVVCAMLAGARSYAAIGQWCAGLAHAPALRPGPRPRCGRRPGVRGRQDERDPAVRDPARPGPGPSRHAHHGRRAARPGPSPRIPTRPRRPPAGLRQGQPTDPARQAPGPAAQGRLVALDADQQ